MKDIKNISCISILLPCLLSFSLSGLLFVGVSASPAGFTFDFEDKSLVGWTASGGSAFAHQPTLGDNPTARNRGMPSGHQGNWWIGTYEKYQGLPGQKAGDIQGDVPQGILESPSFPVEGGTLSFLVGGGSGEQTRVELDILSGTSWEPVLTKSGKNSETMERVTWDLSPYKGKTARIRIVDTSSGGWGHINVDNFKFVIPPSELVGVYTGALEGPHGELKIESDPSGANLKINDTWYGTTPTQITISPGNYLIFLKHEGYMDFTKVESIKSGLSLQYTLTPVFTAVTVSPIQRYTPIITSDPSGAVLKVDGKSQGVTPLQVIVDPGMHEFSLTLDGYEDFVINESITSSLPRQYHLTPVSEQPTPGGTQGTQRKIIIDSTPRGATVMIDGEERGKTPVSLFVKPETVVLLLKKSDYEDLATTVDFTTVQDNKPLVFNLTQITGPTPEVTTPTPTNGPGFSIFTAIGTFLILGILGFAGSGRR